MTCKTCQYRITYQEPDNDYEESCLCIAECQSDIKPEDMTTAEIDYLSRKLIKHISQDRKLKDMLINTVADTIEWKTEERTNQIFESLDARMELLEYKVKYFT